MITIFGQLAILHCIYTSSYNILKCQLIYFSYSLFMFCEYLILFSQSVEAIFCISLKEDNCFIKTMAVQIKSVKQLEEEKNSKRDDVDSPAISNNLNAPKHGTVIPNRVFVGGISSATTEQELNNLFSKYGKVLAVKIILDRAGVSKGYGFVTFESDDEARRSQSDAENIMLGARRLNIAPAIKKQGFVRGSYEYATATPIPSHTQVHRSNGTSGITFHNGMAYFPQPAPQPMHQQPAMEPPQVYQQAGTYGTLTPASPGPGYTFSFPQQSGQIYYPAIPPYPYHLPFDHCYDGQVVIGEGNVIFSSPYFVANTPPAHEITYYQAPPIHGHEPIHSYQPYVYNPRGYESPTVYTPESKCGLENGISSHSGGDNSNPEDTNRPVTSSTAVLNSLPDGRPGSVVLQLRDSQPPHQFFHPQHIISFDQAHHINRQMEINNVPPTYRRQNGKRNKYTRPISRQPPPRTQSRPFIEQQQFQPRHVNQQLQLRPAVQLQRQPRPAPIEQQNQPRTNIEQSMPAKNMLDQAGPEHLDNARAAMDQQNKPTSNPKQQGHHRSAIERQDQLSSSVEQQSQHKPVNEQPDPSRIATSQQEQIKASEQQQESPKQEQQTIPSNGPLQTQNNRRDQQTLQRNQQTPHHQQQGYARERQQRQQRNTDSRRTPPSVSNPSHPPNPSPHYSHTLRHTLAPTSHSNSYFPPPPPAMVTRSRSFHPRHNGHSRGRGKWTPHRGEDTSAQLTPPDTPRANGAPTVSTSSNTSDVVQSMQALAI